MNVGRSLAPLVETLKRKIRHTPATRDVLRPQRRTGMRREQAIRIAKEAAEKYGRALDKIN